MLTNSSHANLSYSTSTTVGRQLQHLTKSSSHSCSTQLAAAVANKSAPLRFEEAFDRFVHANSSKSIGKAFDEICHLLAIDRKQIFEKAALPINPNASSAPNKSNRYQTVNSHHQFYLYQNVKPTRLVYQIIKSRTDYWKANELWKKYDKRANLKDYARTTTTRNTIINSSSHHHHHQHQQQHGGSGGGGGAFRELEVLIIGCGPVGLRLAIECAFLGHKVSIVEKRDRFSRNNVLHLWPYTIIDLKNLGAKQFYGKFCAGSIDHISIRKLQCVLLKVALLVGVQVHFNTSFEELIEPKCGGGGGDGEQQQQQQQEETGWRARVIPENHPIAARDFDVIIGADGRRNTLPGFNRKEFRGRLAIGITANFVNYNTAEEAEVEERSGVAFIFDLKFFLDLRSETGIDLENIVYYKDDTHYFVMTAKKQSLIDKQVIKQDMPDAGQLLAKENVNFEALCDYAKEAAYVSTNRRLCRLDFAKNHYGLPDVAMFDFTSLFQSENASKIVERRGKSLLMALVGDSLLEPFWPLGTGIARGFIAAFDTAWQIKGFAHGRNPLDLLCERESIYQLLSQTTHDNMSKNYQEYTIDPTTRYINLNIKMFQENQIRHLFDNSDEPLTTRQSIATQQQHYIDFNDYNNSGSGSSGGGGGGSSSKKHRTESQHTLLHWCQMVVQPYGLQIENFTSSWKSGLAFAAILNRFRSDLCDYNALANQKDPIDVFTQLFECMRHKLSLNIEAIPEEFVDEPNKFTVLMLLDKLYGLFKTSELNDVSMNQSMTNEEETQYDTLRSKKMKKSSPQQSKGAAALNVNVNVNNITNLFESKIESKFSTSSTTTIGGGFVGGGAIQASSSNRIFPSASSSALLTNSWSQHSKQQPKIINKRNSESLDNSDSSSSTSSSSLSKKQSPHDEEEECCANGPTMCYICNKKVYLMERQTVMDIFMHNNCFKCSYCARALRKGFYSYLKDPVSLKYVFYCTNHLGMVPTNSTTLQRRRKIQTSNLMSLKRSSKYSIDKSLGIYEKLDSDVANDNNENYNNEGEEEEELESRTMIGYLRNRVEIVDKKINERVELEFPSTAQPNDDSSSSSTSPSHNGPSTHSLSAFLKGLSSSKLDRSYHHDQKPEEKKTEMMMTSSKSFDLLKSVDQQSFSLSINDLPTTSSTSTTTPKSRLKKFNIDSYFDDKNLDKPLSNFRAIESSKEEINTSSSSNKLKRSTVCNVCKRNTLISDRIRLQGLTFHRECIKCNACGLLLDNKEEFCNRMMVNQQMRFYCVNHVHLNGLEQSETRSSDLQLNSIGSLALSLIHISQGIVR